MKSKAKYLLISGLIIFFSVGLTSKTYCQDWKRSTVNNNNIYYDGTGKVGIGTDDPHWELTVAGTTHAEEVIVDLNVLPDFVFEETYNLKSLKEVEDYIKIHKHLPEIPSAKEVKEKGLNSGEMQAKLLQKIEELTLYVIEMKKENDKLRMIIQGKAN